MDMRKIEAAAETPVPGDVQAELRPAQTQGAGSIALGLFFLAVALPYWTLRLVGGALWRDVRRAGRGVRAAGAIYADALKRS